jgi:hypothetical protein
MSANGPFIIKSCYLQENGVENHHVKWNKPHLERQIRYFLSYAELHECKRMTVWWGTSREGEGKWKDDGAQYDWSILYACMKIE